MAGMQVWMVGARQGLWLLLAAVLLAGCQSAGQQADKAYREGLQRKAAKQFPQAAQQFRQALAVAPHHVAAHTELGILLCREQRFGAAIKHLLRAIESGEADFKREALLGYAYERAGRLHLAESAYRRAIRRAPRLVDVRLRLADVLEWQGQRNAAARVLREALFIQPQLPQAAMVRTRGKLLAMPETPDVHYGLAALYVQAGQIRRGLAEYRQAVPYDPANLETVGDFGLFCLKYRQFAAAASYLRQAQNGHSRPAEIQLGFGQAAEALRRPRAAVAAYRAALTLQPERYELHAKIAALLEQTGDKRGAAAELERLFQRSLRLNVIEADAARGQPINQLWREILRLRGEQTRKAVVELHPSGTFNVVTVVVNQQIAGNFFVDERAEYTILSERLAAQLGIQLSPRTSAIHFQFDGRWYAAPLVNLPSLQIGGLEVRNLPTLIWNLAAYPDLDGVLGRSFLKHFQLEFRHDEHLLVLETLYS